MFVSTRTAQYGISRTVRTLALTLRETVRDASACMRRRPDASALAPVLTLSMNWVDRTRAQSKYEYNSDRIGHVTKLGGAVMVQATVDVVYS